MQELEQLVIRWQGMAAALRRQDPAAAEAVDLCANELDEALQSRHVLWGKVEALAERVLAEPRGDRAQLGEQAARLLRDHVAGENVDDLMHHWAEEWDALTGESYRGTPAPCTRHRCTLGAGHDGECHDGH